MKPKAPPRDRSGSAPATLSKPAQALWRSLTDEFSFGDALGTMMLEEAMIAWDRAREATLLIAKDGAVLTLPDGSLRRHPAVGIEQAARAQMTRLFRELGMNVEPVNSVGRPNGR